MTTTVLGVGVGLFIILSCWAVALLLCFISHRTKKNTGSAAIATAALITIILIVIPRESEIPRKVVFKVSSIAFFLGFAQMSAVFRV